MSKEKKEFLTWSDAMPIRSPIRKRPSTGSPDSADLQWEDSRSRPSSQQDFEEEMRLGKISPEEDSEPESDGRFYSFAGGGGNMPEKLFKVIIIGDPTVGKTSFLQRFVQNTYKRDYKGTVGVDFALKIMKWSDTQTVKLQLWDIAGQERFTWMTRVYYKDAHGCIIMFDLTNKNSFINSLKWKKDVDTKCTLPDGRPIPCMLLANKCDLSHRQVDLLDVETFHKEHNFIGWTETSAKEGLMVNDSMRFLVDVMMRQDDMDIRKDDHEDSIRLTGPAIEKKKCSC